MNRTGIFFIGASGDIAPAVIAGARAMRKGLCKRAGMVTELPRFSGLTLADPESFAFGGWDIRQTSVIESARNFFRSSQLPYEIRPLLEADLVEVGPNICRGVSTNCGKAIEFSSSPPAHERDITLSAQVMMLRKDIQESREMTA